MDYRWVLEYAFNQKTPIFYCILKQAIDAGVVELEVAFVDSTMWKRMRININLIKNGFEKKHAFIKRY